MLTVGQRTGRNYINNDWNKYTHDECMLFKSVPMHIVNKMLKVPVQKNDFAGIKQVYNEVPPRPNNLLAMVEALSRVTGEPINAVAKRLLTEEKKVLSDQEMLFKQFDETDDEGNYVVTYNPVAHESMMKGQPTIQNGTQTDWYTFKQDTPNEMRIQRTGGIYALDLSQSIGNNLSTQTEFTKPPTGYLTKVKGDIIGTDRYSFHSDVPSSYETPQSIAHLKSTRIEKAVNDMNLPMPDIPPKRLFQDDTANNSGMQSAK